MLASSPLVHTPICAAASLPPPFRRHPPQVSMAEVEKIKKTAVLVQRLKSLKEVNVEFMVVDSRTAVTNHPMALVKLMGEKADMYRQEGEREMDQMVMRVATLLMTLGDYPSIRWGRPGGSVWGGERRSRGLGAACVLRIRHHRFESCCRCLCAAARAPCSAWCAPPQPQLHWC